MKFNLVLALEKFNISLSEQDATLTGANDHSILQKVIGIEKKNGLREEGNSHFLSSASNLVFKPMTCGPNSFGITESTKAFFVQKLGSLGKRDWFFCNRD